MTKVEAEPLEAETVERLYLRDIADGHLFAYTEELVGRPELEVVSESDAYPERHMPKHVAKKAKDDDDGLDLAGGITAESGAEKPQPTDPALAKQAGKGLPK